ncbi:hypothetical protein MYAM1_001192 [Malassezia yamatoensis]|uniref:Alkyl hydroperoxide reductase subunit C/ Thiol specific antioxidant domain-containing protein n=1 Tax=Malassezia yamatoensis TaxID=253288 RepID=A0AAJ5YQ75_9BASI|nr:hypothetical protein MYAM1_001192 [Malassezia yamatoensis]
MHAVEKDMAVFHLPGHPLPALTILQSTDRGGPEVDLFLLSLSRPILLSRNERQEIDCSDSHPSSLQLLSFKSHLAALKSREPNLVVFGLSTQPEECQSYVHKKLGLPFPLLSDSKGTFSQQLELPSYEQDGRQLLQRCVLLLREGQVTRVDYPLTDPSKAALRAEYMLQRDSGQE